MGSLYVPITSNSRVLGYTTVPTTTEQRLISSWDSSILQLLTVSHRNGNVYPAAVVNYRGNLLVADYHNNRVLIWNSLPTSTQTPADVVVGQPSMTTNASGCTNSTLTLPESILAPVVNGSLIVADTPNNRVLIWNTIPTTNGAAADMVGGQPSLHYLYGSRHASATSFANPIDIASNGTHLAITDLDNNRVLIWNTIPSCTPRPARFPQPLMSCWANRDSRPVPPIMGMRLRRRH